MSLSEARANPFHGNFHNEAFLIIQKISAPRKALGRTSPHQQGACHSAWGACLLCSREEEVWLSPRRLEQASPALSEAQQANLWQSQGTFSKTHFQNFSPCPSSQSALIHTHQHLSSAFLPSSPGEPSPAHLWRSQQHCRRPRAL